MACGGNWMNKRSYAGIDYFRMIAALLVVAIHVAPFAVWSKGADFMFTYCLGRIAVPFFFMTTGYFVLAPYVFHKEEKRRSFQKFFVKNFSVYVVATLFYVPVSWYAGKLPHSVGEFFKKFFFDGTFYHLWYFPAVLTGCLLLVLLVRKSVLPALAFAIPAYLIALLGDSYYGLIRGVPALKTLYDSMEKTIGQTRNGIFFAPIFLLMGMMLAMPKFRCSRQFSYWGAGVSVCCMLMEGYVSYHMHLQKHNSMYLFLAPTMYFVFQILLYIPGKAPAWVRNSSMLLYIIHPAVIIGLRVIAKKANLTELLIEHTFVHYLAVCALSILAVWLIQVIFGRRGEYVPERAGVD